MHIFDISILGIHMAPSWYGLMYALGFVVCYFFMRRYYSFKQKEHLESLLSYVFCGVVLGWRLGYILLYDLSFFIEHPIQMIRIWEGGMSFHGGLLGTILAVFIFAKRYDYRFWWLIDTLAVIIPVALGLGRIGNWINSELPGYAPYDGIFPMMISWVPHFPSPLLEMLLEGILLGSVMLYFWRRYSLSRICNPRPSGLQILKNQNLELVVSDLQSDTFRIANPEEPKSGILSGIFLIWYSIARLIAEQYRLPDAHIGYIMGTDWMTLGIAYTLPMVGVGVYLIVRKYPL
jgi:phosphatidylglycerol---prolipoprotein diacylglyceryl transferase